MVKGRASITVAIAAIALFACSGAAFAAIGGGGGTFTTTTSTFDHRYDLYYGTLSFTRAGEATPYLTRDGFSFELKVDQAAANRIGSDLTDPRVVAGLAGPAPDGGSWIAGAARPDWWRFPNGTSRPESEPTFDARSEFQRQIDPTAELAGSPTQCTDSTAGYDAQGHGLRHGVRDRNVVRAGRHPDR